MNPYLVEVGQKIKLDEWDPEDDRLAKKGKKAGESPGQEGQEGRRR
ncbi:MAG: hypothetical protein MUE67_08265 [Anaerolineales bacterium]|nr:hypothetical protein [Anaerolineales bacterium]